MLALKMICTMLMTLVGCWCGMQLSLAIDQRMHGLTLGGFVLLMFACAVGCSGAALSLSILFLWR